jgi:NAD(P)-dependent dehydrogenase (short-subunit alcohol dehydrogenase family)
MQAGDMSGKVALVTGAGGGIGAATALALATVGADVALVDVKADGLAETAAKVVELGRQCLPIAADLATADACRDVVTQTVARLGRLDALCNVAGILKLAHAHEMATADWNLVLAVNLSAPFFLSQAALPHLIETSGAIVNVSSLAAHIPTAYQVAYGASKAALSHMTGWRWNISIPAYALTRCRRAVWQPLLGPALCRPKARICRCSLG